MKPCKHPGCDNPKGLGKGRQYCDEHRDQAKERRRVDAVTRIKRWVTDNRIRHSITNRANRYGLHPDDFLELLEFQDGCCAICRQAGGLDLQIDHDHKTGEVRGLLCRPCNNLIALARDRVHILDSAGSYLVHPAVKQAIELIHGEISS